jgi:hypothetical protein
MSSQSFLTSDMMSKNEVLTSISTYFCQMSSRSADPADPPFHSVLLVLHPSPGEVPPSRGLQFGAAPVNISVIFQSRCCIECRGGGRFSFKPSLSLFLTRQLTPHRSGLITKAVALYDTPSKYQGRNI